MALRINNAPKKGKRKYLVYVLALVLIAGTSFGVLFLFYNVFSSGSSSEGNIFEKPIQLIKKEPEPEPKPLTDEVVSEIETYLAGQTGTYGYMVIELDDGREFGTRDGTYYIAASSIKVAIATYLYDQVEKGNVSWDKYLTYIGADYEGGTGSIQGSPVGSNFKVSYLLERMIAVSDNVATNILIRYLGRTNIQNYLDKNGFTEIRMATNDVTPRGMARILASIYRNELISKKNSDELLSYMKKSITPTRLVAGVPSSIEVAHKIGSWSGAMSDIGIVFAENRAYAISVYSSGVGWGEVTDGVIAGISKRVYDFETSF